uniref:Spectrin repeat containing nuclear envelope protein 1 n=1 Tax=Oncorhynchus mykiss TaxID=8022 RepID=A0A8K9XYB1_ONCMY
MQRLQDEQEAVQKRTFTKWINSHLAKRVPSLVVTDLFEDIKDGVMLLALLEVLSGQKLPCEQGRKLRRIHWVSNIGTALNFLEGRKSAYRGSPIKLVNINSTDIVDGRPSIVLGLIWTIILYFQIEELTSNLPALQALSSSTSSVDSSDTTSPPVKRKPLPPLQGGARKALLRWVQQTATKHLGMDVKDFGPSWRTGVAFFAVILSLRPHLVDMERVRRRANRENLQEAFSLAETELGIPQLLDPEDVDVDKPDEKSIMTYVAQFLKHHPNPGHQQNSDSDSQPEEEVASPVPLPTAPSLSIFTREQRKGLRELKTWLDQLELDTARTQETKGNLSQQYQSFKSVRVQLEMNRKQVEAAVQSTQKDGMLTVDQALVKQAWDRVSNRLLGWHLQLDRALPAPLGVVGEWLHQAEGALRQEVTIQQTSDATSNTVHMTLEQHKDMLKGLEGHQQVFQRIHKDRSVNGVPVPQEQLQDMAERMNFVSTSSNIHLAKMEFWENKHHMQAFLMLAESKLKSWIIKYGRRESVELMLQNYVSFVEGQQFFEQYETLFQTLKQSSELYVKADGTVDEGEAGVRRFMREVLTQWRSLSVEVRSVRSMLDEVLSNWERYSCTVASLQAWLEDAEGALSQPENIKREFFRNLSQWIDQHSVMNDAGNFLIETCDETVSRDLKQQLLLLNGRWRDLFVKVKQYAREDELDKCRRDHMRAISALRELLDGAEVKLNAPVQVSFLNIRSFLQDVENTKKKVVAMETQYKLAACSAQLLSKDAPQEEGAKAMATMTTVKGQLSKVRERCPSLVRECHGLLPLLEEMEKHITGFYQALERAIRITAAVYISTVLPLLPQDLLSQQQSCKMCLSVIERNLHSLQRTLSSSKALRNFDQTLLQKRVAEIQTSEVGEWRRQEEANSTMRRRFEESRQDLERVLKVATTCLGEGGNAEELLRKQSEFFGQLDQRVLSVFLKACDDLTDILPEEEQQALQDTVRTLHKQWKDIQMEAPFHLQRLKVEAERGRAGAVLQECRAELAREIQALTTTGSETVIREHRAFFREKAPLSVCEKSIGNMEELCQTLPDNDSARQTLDSTRRALADVKGQIEATHLKLQQHSQWREWNDRFSELSDWLLSQRSQVRLLRERARDRSHQEQRAAEGQEESLSWLNSRLAVLTEVSPEVEAIRQRAALAKLSSDLTALLSSLLEVNHLFFFVMAIQLSTCHEGTVSICLQGLHKKSVEYVVQTDSLSRKAAEIQLGPKNQTLLQQQAQQATQQVTQLEASLKKNVDLLEMVCVWWERFIRESEAFSSWISERERELDTVDSNSSSDPLEKHISTRAAILSHLEAESEALSGFVTPGEAGRIRARLAQMERYWEELKESVEQLGGELNQSATCSKYTDDQSRISMKAIIQEFTPWHTHPYTSLLCRLQQLQTHLSQVELFDEALLTLTQWSENFLSVLRTTSQVNIADLQAAVTQVKHEESLREQTALRETLQQRESSLLSFSSPEAQQQLQGQREDCLQPLSEAQHLLLLRGESLAELGVFLQSHGAAAGEVRGLREAVEGRGSWDRSKAEELHHRLGEVAGDVARLEAQAVGLDGRLSKAHLHLSGAEWKGSREGGLGQGPGQGRTSCRGQAVALMVALEGVQRGLGWRQSQAEALGALWTSFRERREEVMRSLRELEERARQEGARESSVQAFQNSLRFFVQLEDELQSLQHSQQWLRERGSQLAQRDSELAGEALREVGLVETAWDNVRKIITDGIQTNADRLGHCVSLWDDLKTMERDIDQWAAASIADLTEGVANLSDKQGTETHLATFQVRPMTVNTLSPLPPPQDLQSALQQQRGDIDMARETLSSLCRSHPSQELTHMSSDLTLLAKRTEAAAQLSSRTRGTLQDALQLRFNSEQRVKFGFCVAQERVEEGEQHLDQVCGEAERLLLHLPKAGSGQVQERLSSCQRDWVGYKEGYVALPSLSPPRSSLDRLSQEAQSLREAGRGCGGEVKATAQLQTHHQTLLQGTRERLRGCLESQAFGETLHGVWLWLEDIQERLGSLGSTMGNKKELEERLEQVQDILLLKGEGEVKLNMAVGKGELAIRSNSAVAGQEVIRSQLQEVEDVWATLLVTAMSCHSRLEWTVAQWGCYLDSEAQLQCWLEAVEGDICGPLIPQPGLREKASQLERLQTLLADLQEHQGSLSSLEERAAELFKKTGDAAFSQEARAELQGQFDDLIALVEVRKLFVGVVREHQQYLETVRELTDWLMSAGEELQRWSDTLGDSVSLQRRLSEVIKDVCDSSCRLLEGRDRLSRVRRSSGATAEHTAAGGCEAMDRQLGALAQALEQWEGAALRARDGLERALTTATEQEQEYERLTARMEEELRELDGRLKGWSQELSRAEGRSSGEEAVEGWQQETLEGLLSAEPMADRLKAQLNDLVRYSRDLGPHSDRVTALIKQHNSLSLRASRECQNKERLLEQRFRAALRDFQQWLVNVKISTAKCFDIPQSVTEASTGLLRIQEFLNDREHGQARLSAVGTSGELLMAVVPKDREEGVKAKVANARDDWKSLMTNLQMRETALKNLQSQMRDFEVSTEPLQDWLNSTEVIVQESSARLHDLPAKRQELSKLQRVLEELSCREAELGKLRERAHRLWEGQAAGKGFVHRVSQLSAQYLALSNLTKDKASRIERIVGEHRLFSQGLTELQNWVSEAERILNTCLSPTADKTVLEDRMIQLEALLAARQEREIQLKMLLTRGEAVQRNTSAEGVPVVRKQIQDLKDSWDSLLSASIQCKSQLEGALSQWTSYQEDVVQFIMWMERVETTLGCSDRQYSEMRDKTANLGKTKLLYEEVLSHRSPLETIATKGSNMAEQYTTHQEVHSLQERYTAITDKAKAAVYKAKDLVLAHQEYQRGLHMFEDWLEQEQGTLGSLSHPEGDVDTLENTLQQIQLLQERCSQGQSLLSSLLSSRDGVIPWGAPQIEDRALDTAQREWGAYQARLGETRATLGSTLGRLRQMGQRFQSLVLWLEDMEGKLWQESVLARQSEVDGLSALAQQVLEETHISSRVSTRATQLTARYHALILNIQETIKQLKEELRSIEEAEKLCVSFSDWLRSAQKNFRTVTASTEALDRVAMERKMKKVEVLNTDTPGHGLLKALRERAERAAGFLEEAGAEGLGGEVEARLAQLEELAGGLRQEHSTLERAVCLAKEFQDRYKAQAQWVVETRAMLSAPLEPKAELYQKRAQLAKYKALLQTVQSHDSAVRLVVEKGESLLLSVQYPSIRDNMNRLQTDYTELGNAIMEEIAGFEDRLSGLKERGDDLVEGCSERVQSRLRQQVQAQQQGTRDSYSAICSTAQRVYQSLDRELQRHVSLQDALQQCQTWLVSVSEEPEPTAHLPLSLEEALQQVKHERTLQEQASTYLQLVCSTCDLSEQRVRETAQDIQQVKLQVSTSQYGHKSIDSTILIPSSFYQEFLQQLRVKQFDVTQLREAVAGLTEGQSSPALEEMGGLRRAWEELGQRAEELEGQRGEDMQRSGEYHDCVAAVEELFHQVSREWDYLARADTESTSEHLEALRKLCCDLEDQRGTLEELRDQKQSVLPRLSLLDKELVKQQVGHLEKRWSQLDSLIQGKIQDSSQTLEDLGRVEAQLREAREWMEEQRPALTSALKTSPPPDLAQSFLFDHLSVCVELEARGQLLGQAVSEAQRVASRLGLSERRRLQELVLQAEGEVEALGARVSQRRKYLSKAFTERTQFLQAVGRALSWVQQQERKALMDDHVALLPDDLTKQVVTCRGVQSGLRAYQGELASLWVQGRDLERDATDQERGETVTRLEELQRVFETAFQRTTHRLQDLDRALTSRKYFKVDLDRTCHWLRRADGITFPEIDFTCNADDDSELQVRLAKFQNVLEQASEYENLLLIVQRVGQEILPSLKEVDHCYLDEKLNALPQQYNSILALAKEKRDRIQQAILERKDYDCFFNVTCRALEELQEQLDGLAKRTVSIQEQEVVHLRHDHRDLSESLSQLSPAVRELRRKTEGFLSRGQRCHAEETEQLVNLHDNLKRTIDQRLKHLDDSLKTLAEYNATSAKLDSELKSVKEQFTRMKADSDTTLGGTERLTSLYTLLEDLERMGSHLERLTQHTEDLGLNCDPAAIQASREVVTSHQKELQSVRSEVKDCVTECENCLKKDKEFEKETGRTSDWLKSLRKKLGEPLTLPEVKVEMVEEEVRRLKVVEEEVQSRMRVADAMGSREKQRYSSRNEACPAHVEANLEELAKLRADIQQALRTKQTLSLVKRHQSTQQSARKWLDEAGAFLQRTTLGIELENQTESLRELEEISAQELAFMAKLDELETLGAQLDGLVGLEVTKEMKESERKKEGVEVICAAQWSSFQTEREELIGQMNETGSMMTAFPSAKAANSQEAEDKLQSYKFSMISSKATDLALVGSESSKAAIGHSVSSLWQRWTRLRSVARAQERALEDTARDWRSFREKVGDLSISTYIDLHARVPDSTVEKAATRAALQNLLEYHDSFSLEVEREQSALALLGQHTLSLIGEDQEEEDMEMEKTDKTREETPCLKEIRSILVLQVRGSRAQVQQELREREEVERELGLVKGWIQDTRGLLLSPSSDLDSLLHELEVISRRQSVERMVELQQNKYQDLQTALPSELSMQLAEVTLALGSAEDQVPSPSGTPPSGTMGDLKCEGCGRSLAELVVAVQEFGDQNPLLCKQLGDALSRLAEVQRLTTQQAQERANQLHKQAEQQLEEYKGMRQFLLGWAEKAETLVTGNIIWSSASQLQEQIRAHQAVLRECRGLHGDLEAMGEREGQLGEVLQMEGWSQQVKQLSRCTEELQQSAKTRLQSLQDAAKDMVRLEAEVKTLHDSLDQAQLTLTSPDLARLSLREQLTHRQRLLVEMEAFKQQVQAVQLCQSALRLPEEVVASLSICRTAQSLQQEASQLQHTTIQQCNILQEAVVQYEQYEQEVRNLQRLIEEAHRIIQDRPVSTSNIHELQAQIHHHEELALKIRGYQEQIASLNSKCKMLTVKAKHATMLLTVSEVEGLSDGMDELSDEELPTKQPPAHPSVVMMTAGRCHTLLSPVTEESGEEGTNSEVSSPACRSPSPGANADTPLNQVLHRRTPQLPPTHSPELYDPSLESNANLDDLQRSWETLKNVISEKQKTLYEALERQQHYQESLQSISTKMESIEGALNEGLESRKSPESQMAAHQALMDEILMLQDEIGDLQTCFSEELCDGLDSDSDPGDQLALHSTLTVLGERMATIRMKASGKRQLLEERLSEQLEEQRQEQALQRYHSEAEELDHWLLSTKATLSSALQPHPEDMDMEEQLIDCQNMLFEIEQKVASLSELSVHSESLLLEGRAGTRGEAEQLTFKLHSLKDSLVELQRMLQDKQVDIQGSLQEQEDSEPDSILSQSPNIQDWLSQARSTRTQQHHDNLLRQRVGYDIALSCTCTIPLYCTMTLHISFPLECGLSKEVREVTGEMSKCRELLVGGGGAAGGGRRMYGGEEQALMEDTLDGLQERLGLLDQTLEQHCDCMRDRLQEHTGFQVATVHVCVCVCLFVRVCDAYEELVLMVGSRRSSLNHSLSLKAQYESALHDLTDLVDTAQDKMAADQKMTVGSVIEVQILLDKHKEFFQGLECHMILTQTFYSKVSGLVVQRESQVLEETLALANNVLKQAHRRGVELEGILESWSMLVEDYQALYRQLEAVECSIPTVGLVEETEERLSDRITLYQRLKTSLTEHQPQLYQVMEEGKRLLLSVCCSDLENQLTQLGEHWLCSTTKVNKELHRFDSTLKHWSRYQSESAELSQWLRSALDRLEFWTTQSVTVPQELETVRDHLYAFLEFSKEVDAKSSLRSSVLSTGNQLLRLKRVDTAGLRSALAQVDTQWAELFTRIPVVQEKLHQLQMEKLASRHAITELMSWISLMENVIAEDQQRIMGAVGSEVVQDYLQKYKGFSIDLTCKQLTVDFVNQSVLQISSQDVEGKRSDKTDFAERLGAMNRRWQILQGLIIEKIQLLEGLLEGWMEHENGVQALKTWLTLQEDKLKKRHRIDDVASVQNALKDCQELEELVKEKEKDLEKAEERGSGLIQEKRGQACSVVMETLKGLNQSWANLDNMIGQMKVSLRSVLEQWTLYRRAAEEINGYLMEGRYSVSRLHLLTGSLEAVQQQVESLENLQEELDKQESSLRKFGSVTHQLLTECHPSVADTLDGALRDVNIRWNGLLEQISEQLRSSKALLGLWQRYTELYDQSVSAVHKQEERTDRLLKSATDRDVTEEESNAWIRDCSELLGAQATVQQSLLQLQQLGEQLKTQVDASSMAALQSDCLSLTHRLATLEHALHRQQEVLQVGHLCYSVTKQLDSLTCQAEEAEEVLRESDPVETPDHTVIQKRMEKLKSQMCQLSSHSPDLERVNELAYRLPLNDREIKCLQSLNRAWTTHSAHLTERFSKLQAVLLQQQSFLQKCEDWMDFLSQTEQKLAADTSGNYHSLLEQQRDHELFQTEMFSRQQILYSIISDGHRLLDQGQVDDRDDFSLKLALLGNQWQGVVRRAQQRRGIIDSLVRQWQRYREMAEKLRRWLQDVSRDPEVHQQGEAVALQEARTMLDQIQLRERVLQRQQGGYILAVEAGRSLLLSADARAESALQTELMDMQECWRHANVRLDEQKRELLSLLKDWGRCEKGIAASLEKLRAFKRKLSLPLPDNHEELHSEQVRCKELESNVDGWTDDLTSLFLLRDSLEGVVSADDLTVLQDRLQLLQRQWEEICHQLSLRRQQVSEKLNEWAVFNEKNKDLCEWLTQMESKVSQNGDISIQEMIEKLRKDYQEEIGVAQENKQQLQVMGERLARASHESKAAEIQHKLSKVSERWQHLLDLIAARVKKLRETLVAVQQLDKNMCSLRSWLAHIETELTRPLVYDTCDAQEIQRKLNQQQDIQRDIEKHSTGVASVLNLCEVLLHDCDACSTETECDSIQQATRGLDRRWRNICAMSMERRLKIEETWRLWQKFLDDFSRFEEWLKTSERTAALPNSSGVLYTIAKEELKKFEAFQRQVQEFLTQLELINKQYRRLARENRTDSSCRLREMVHDGNRRWDNLQKRVASILRRLKHFIGQREEFETARDSILVWLTEMDLQLTNIEHFSECDVQAKIKQLRAFQQEISLNTGQIELVFRQGEALIEKSEPLDGAVLEEELEELQRYWQEVFGRVDRYYKKLTRLPLADDELDCSDRDLDMDESADLSDLQWGDSSLPCPSSLPTSGSVLPPQADRSGRDTPASMDSIPLEWDHDYDLSRGLESAGGRGLGSERGRGQEQEEEYLRSAAAVLSDVVIPESPEAYIKLTESTLRSSSGRQLATLLEAHLRQLDQAVDSGRYSVQQGEAAACSGQASTSPELDSTYMGYMRLMGECRGSIDAVKRAGGQLTEEDDDMPGLTNPTSTDSQSAGVIERWELIQARSLRDKHRQKQNLQQCHQLISDLQTMRAWLCEAEAELGQLRVLDLSTDIHTIQQRIRKLKELQKTMDGHKSQVLSINLSSADFLQSDPDSKEAWELRDGLKEMNSRWDWLGSSLEDWRAELQRALMQCQEFHELSHGLLLWLENIDRRRNEVVPIPPRLDRETLRAHHRTLTQIKRELLDSQQKASSLQELSAQLLVHTQGSEHLEAQEKVHVIGNRLRLLLREVSTDLEGLERRLETMDTQPRGKSSHSGAGCASSRSDFPLVPSSSSSSCPPRGQSFILRVLRAALPLQLLLLLLIGLACLVPMTEEDYSCHHANNFARSFHPMLRYTNGPPPI